MPSAHIEAPEFIKKVMEGERDFTGIRLTDVDIAGDYFTFLELSEYLQKHDLKTQPIILNEANVEDIRAGGVWMPYLKAKRASFKNAYFLNANLQFSDFSNCSFFNTDLQNANCEGCDFYKSYFKNTSLNKTNVKAANFKYADLTGCKQLDEALELANAKFELTYVGPAEEQTILKALRQRPDFHKVDVSKLFHKRPIK